MQSSTLGGTYAAYKASTTDFTTWLTGEAETRGYRSPNVTSQTTTISCIELLKRVDFIVRDSSAKLSVPIPIQNVLQHAIKARRKCSAWFEAMSDKANAVSQANKQETPRDGYLHFIEVLEEAFETLTPFFGETPKRKRTKAKKFAKQSSSIVNSAPENEMGTLSNRFGMLEVEVPQDDCNSGSGPSRPVEKVPGNSHTKTEIKIGLEVQKEDDVKFIVFCFFEDLRELREFLQETWKHAMMNESDISAASVITNVALDLVSKSEENIIPLATDDAAGVDSYWHIFRHIVPDEYGSSPKNGVEDCAKATWIDTIYLCIYHALRNYILHSRDPQSSTIIPCVRPLGVDYQNCLDVFETLDLESEEWLIKMLHDLWLDGYYDKAKEDMTYLGQAGWFQKPQPTSSPYRVAPIEDSITRALKLALVTGSIGVTAVFAARIMLDIHKIVGNGGIQLEEKLRHQAAIACSNLQVVWTTEHGPVAEVASMAEPCCNADHRYRQSLLAWILQNILYPKMAGIKSELMSLTHLNSMLKTQLLNIKDPRCIQLAEDPGFYYKNNPLWLGLESFRFEIHRMDYGMHRVNCSASTASAAHIYNAVRQASFLDLKWETLDHFIALHIGDLFRGSLPTKKDEIENRFLIFLGASAKAFAKDSRESHSLKHTTQRYLAPPKFLQSFQPIYKYLFIPNDYITHAEKLLYTGGNHGARTNSSTSQLDLLKHLKDLISDMSITTKVDYLTMAQQCNQIMADIIEQVQQQDLWSVVKPHSGIELKTQVLNLAFVKDLLVRDSDISKLRTRIKFMSLIAKIFKKHIGHFESIPALIKPLEPLFETQHGEHYDLDKEVNRALQIWNEYHKRSAMGNIHKKS
jgi:hypothetical protein